MNTQVERQAQERHIRQTVRLTKGFWLRAGVPVNIRRARAEELRAHLQDAVANDRRVSDVVGTDLAAFAAEWASADMRRPWIEPVASVVSIALLLPSLGTLLHVLLLRPDEWGLLASQLAYSAAIVLIIGSIQAARWFRTRLTRAHLGVLIVATGAGFVTLMAISMRLERDDQFLTIPPLATVAMLAAVAVIHGTLYWLKREQRL